MNPVFDSKTKDLIININTTGLDEGDLIEYCGYKTDVMEFVDMEHSPKNILIRARKTNVNSQKREKSLEEAQKMCREFSVEQKLMSLILDDSV